MRKLVLEAYELKFMRRLFTVFLVLFVSMVTLMLLNLARGGAPREAFTGILIYVIFAAIVTALMVFSLRKMGEGPKKAARLAGETMLEGNRLVFPAELEFEYGRVVLIDHPKRRRPDRGFKALGMAKASVIEFQDQEFKIVARGEEGFASLPAIRVITKPYERVVLLFLTDRGRVVGKRLIAGTEDGLDVEVEGRGRELVGKFYRLREGRKINVLINIPENPSVSVKVADSSSPEFRYSMLPYEKTVVFCPSGGLSVGNLTRSLGYSFLVLGHGEFLLKFTLPGPRGKELGAYKFEVVLGEKEGW